MILATIPVLSNSRTTGYAPCSVTGSAAFHAPPRSRFLHAQVLAFVGMALWAVGAITLQLASLSSPHVFGVTDEFHVVAIDARPETASVVGLQPLGNRSAKEKPRRARISNLLPANLKSSVSVVEPRGPTPASVLQNLDMAHEPFHFGPECKLIVSHCDSFQVAMGWAAQRTNAVRGPFVYYPMRPGLDNARQKVLSEFQQ